MRNIYRAEKEQKLNGLQAMPYYVYTTTMDGMAHIMTQPRQIALHIKER